MTALPARAVLELRGEDRLGFLQGLVSNDVADAAPGRAVWAALLTPQGKYLADFFIFAEAERLLLDCEAAQLPLVQQKLARQRLRARVDLRPAGELHVHAAWDGTPDPGGIAAPDPRLPEAGWRILSTEALPETADFAAWDAHRLHLGLPDGSRDLEADKTILLEAGFDELHGVSWTKGCYMGQELTARTKYRGLIKRRLLPVVFDGPRPAPGTIILAGAREVGRLHDGTMGIALATLKLDALDEPLECDGIKLDVRRPDWLRLPA